MPLGITTQWAAPYKQNQAPPNVTPPPGNFEPVPTPGWFNPNDTSGQSQARPIALTPQGTGDYTNPQYTQSTYTPPPPPATTTNNLTGDDYKNQYQNALSYYQNANAPQIAGIQGQISSLTNQQAVGAAQFGAQQKLIDNQYAQQLAAVQEAHATYIQKATDAKAQLDYLLKNGQITTAQYNSGVAYQNQQIAQATSSYQQQSKNLAATRTADMANYNKNVVTFYKNQGMSNVQAVKLANQLVGIQQQAAAKAKAQGTREAGVAQAQQQRDIRSNATVRGALVTAGTSQQVKLSTDQYRNALKDIATQYGITTQQLRNTTSKNQLDYLTQQHALQYQGSQAATEYQNRLRTYAAQQQGLTADQAKAMTALHQNISELGYGYQHAQAQAELQRQQALAQAAAARQAQDAQARQAAALAAQQAAARQAAQYAQAQQQAQIAQQIAAQQQQAAAAQSQAQQAAVTNAGAFTTDPNARPLPANGQVPPGFTYIGHGMIVPLVGTGTNFVQPGHVPVMGRPNAV